MHFSPTNQRLVPDMKQPKSQDVIIGSVLARFFIAQ